MITAHIMVASHDLMLLQTRRLLLGAYFEADAIGKLAEAEPLIKKANFDLVTLCYTLSDFECLQIKETFQRHMQTPIFLMLISRRWQAERQLKGDYHVVEVEDGPLALLNKCADLLGYRFASKRRMLPVDKALAS